MRRAPQASQCLLAASLCLLQLSAAQAAEPVDETLLFSVRSERNVLDIFGNGPWKTLKNAETAGAVPGADWKPFIYVSGLFNDKFWPVKPGARIAAASAISDGKASPFWLQTAPSAYQAMSSSASSLVVCPDPGEGATPDAKACLKPRELAGVFPTKTRYKWDVESPRVLRRPVGLSQTVAA